jgi:hypothetical protein
VEAGNMQVDDDPLSMSLTPRIELSIDGILYMNCSDLEAEVNVEKEDDKIIVHTRSRLVDKAQHDPPQGAVHCNTYHTFTAGKIMLSFSCSNTPYDKNIRIVLPVISTSPEPMQLADGQTIHIRKEKATVTITADKAISRLPTTRDRLFNFVPGLEAIPLAILSNEAVIEITVTE